MEKVKTFLSEVKDFLFNKSFKLRIAKTNEKFKWKIHYRTLFLKELTLQRRIHLLTYLNLIG